MRNFIKKGLILALMLTLLIQWSCIGAFAAGEEGEPVYKNFVILGDSLCLGFSTEEASMADVDTYDIEANLLRAAQSDDYKHCYPTQFANRVGIDTFSDISYTNGERWDYREETQWNDVYNFGICAAWTRDIKELLSNPYYLYQYANVNYDKDDTFVLPEDYTGTRRLVDTAAEGYDVADITTWVYLTGEEYQDQMEEYTIPAGTAIKVAYEMDMWGTTYLMLNPIIAEKYYYVSEYCLDGESGFIDDKPIYYPTKEMFSWYGNMYVPDTETYGAKLGQAVQNPQFTKYYYEIATTTVENGDLIALAMGNNDIYHSFMPYQQSSDSMLCRLVYWMTYALQMNYSIGDIMNMMNDPMWQQIIFGDSMPEGSGRSSASTTREAVREDAPAENPFSLSGLISAEEINALLELYSAENVTAYLKDTVAEYKVNYEATIRRVLELKKDRSELVLIGHYNPFGMINYLTMLSEAVQNGQLFDHLSGDMAMIGTLLQAIIGTPEQWEEINDMDEEELAAYAEAAGSEMDQFLSILGSLDLSDPETSTALTRLVTDLSFPLSVLLVGNALSDTYAEMNDFLQEMSEKYDLPYVDVSDAPSSGRYDPHPTKYGHKWIADRLYETVVPQINASVSPASTGDGTLTPLGSREFRLRDSQTYRFLAADGSDISSIFIDGQQIDKEEFASVYASGSYAFENIMKSHSITVQFDVDSDHARKYPVNVLGSYAQYGAGEGMYKAGETVTISAGALDGFEFTGWRAEGAELEDPSSVVTTFEMPANGVTVTATWKAVKDNPKPTTHYVTVESKTYNLSFETNGGTTIPTYTKKGGTVIDLNAFFTTREGYTFDGWYSDKELTKKVTSVELTQNTTVYAKWAAKKAPFPFNDVKKEDWFYNEVRSIYNRGLMNGTSANTFSPDMTTTRGMIVTILYRMEGEPAVTDQNPFSDVKAGSYYDKAITWGAANGIIRGYGNDKFGPDDNITREQMAAILFRYASFKGYDVSARANLSGFHDSGKIGGWAENAMRWAYGKNLIKGVGNDLLDPQGEATRSQVATILYRFMKDLDGLR